MKKLMFGLMISILLISVLGVGFVVAEENDTNQTDINDTVVCDSDNLGLCLDETTCTDASGYWYDNICNADEEVVEVCDSVNLDLCLNEDDCENAGGEWEDNVCVVEDDADVDDDDEGNETDEDNGRKRGLGQIIRGRVKAGVYTDGEGNQIRVSELAKNRFSLNFNGENEDNEVETELEVEEETENNKTKLKIKLRDGRFSEIKIMPDVASETALARLKLKFCNEDNNCSIELKEVAVKRRVGDGNETTAAYEIQAERHAKILAMFRAKMQVKAEVDAETGELIRVKKPWWAFLALESEE